MPTSTRTPCPKCKKPMILVLPPSGNGGGPAMQCIECDGPDPLQSPDVYGWMKGALRPPTER